MHFRERPINGWGSDGMGSGPKLPLKSLLFAFFLSAVSLLLVGGYNRVQPKGICFFSVAACFVVDFRSSVTKGCQRGDKLNVFISTPGYSVREGRLLLRT